MKPRRRKLASAAGLTAALLLTETWMPGSFIPANWVVSTAEARVGRPATPGSVAGTARRTTRRTIRRTTVYVAALPAGCAKVSVSGTSLWRCRGVYYQPYGGRYVVVHVD